MISAGARGMDIPADTSRQKETTSCVAITFRNGYQLLLDHWRYILLCSPTNKRLLGS